MVHRRYGVSTNIYSMQQLAPYHMKDEDAASGQLWIPKLLITYPCAQLLVLYFTSKRR